MSENNNKAPHILNTSANLLGICFLVLTSLKVLKLSGTTFIDECTSVAAILFMSSSILSFLSIRNKSEKSNKYENVADTIFLVGLICLFVTIMMVTFNFMK
jgi:hypothetical protein